MGLPEEYTYGKVVARIIQAVADGPDPNRYPDMLAAGGIVTFKPLEKNRKTKNYSALVLHQNIKAKLYVPATDSLPIFPPGTLVDNQDNEGVWLVTGSYVAEFQLNEGSHPPLEFTLTSDSGSNNPLDLVHVSPPTPPKGVVMVTAEIPPGGKEHQTLLRDSHGLLVWSDPPVPNIVSGATTQVEPNDPAQAELIRTGHTEYRLDFQIPQGLHGDPTAVANFGEAMASEINTEDSVGQIALSSNYEQYDVSEEATDLTNANGVFIAAAEKAKSKGKKTLSVAPGTYQTPGLHPDDILDLYVIGEGVKLEGAWLYPFSNMDWMVGKAHIGRGGRGRIALELDDGSPQHWTDMFPITKEYDFPLGVAWHTGNGARWIKEAYRHGWEIISHLPDNTRATDLTLIQLEDLAKESYDTIKDITGQEEIAFVYPQHARNLETDRVLSKYYTRGRGLSILRPYRSDKTYQEWLTSSYFLDTQMRDGYISKRVKDILKAIATNDTGMVFYFHHTRNQQNTLTAIPDLVEYARSLGIEIVQPSQIVSNRNIVPDPYDLNDPSQYALYGSSFYRSSAQKYHGEGSFAYVAGATPTNSSVVYHEFLPTPNKSGMFTAYRASFRLYATRPIPLTTQLNSGIRMGVRETSHYSDGKDISGSFTGATLAVRNENTIPQSSWDRHSTLLLLDPSVNYIYAGVNVSGVEPNAPTFWIDEIKFELVDYVPEVRYTVRLEPKGILEATTWVTLATHLKGVGKQNIQLVPGPGVTGHLYVSTHSVNTLVIRSSNREDDGEVEVIITPRTISYPDLTFSKEGA